MRATNKIPVRIHRSAEETHPRRVGDCRIRVPVHSVPHSVAPTTPMEPPDDPTSAMLSAPIQPRRHVLPETRRSQTHKFCIGGHEGYLTVGLFEDGRPGEIFIKMSKEGSTLSGLIQGFCRAFSLCLQHGLALEDAVERFRGMRFEPLGATMNPDIPECSSILDYVARYLALRYGPQGSGGG